MYVKNGKSLRHIFLCCFSSDLFEYGFYASLTIRFRNVCYLFLIVICLFVSLIFYFGRFRSESTCTLSCLVHNNLAAINKHNDKIVVIQCCNVSTYTFDVYILIFPHSHLALLLSIYTSRFNIKIILTCIQYYNKVHVCVCV